MKRRNVSLDAVRGLAILLVLIRHLPGEPTNGVMRALFDLGWTGVDLFFVLSGYLISSLLYQELDESKTIDLSRFWLRRGLKIWPSYFACFGLAVAIAATMELAGGNRQAALKRLLASLPNLIFIQNYTGYWWPHTWSIAIEEHFYLLLPLVLLAVRKSLGRRLPLLIVCVCAAVLSMRVLMYFSGWLHWQSYYYPTHLRLDALAFGVLLGYAHHYKRKQFLAIGRYWPLLIGMLPLVGIAVWFPIESSMPAVTVGFTILYLAYGALVTVAATYPEAGKELWVVRVLSWCGIYSYTIYLAHSALSMIPAFGQPSSAPRIWPARALFLLTSIIGGVLLSHLVERPFLAWRQRLWPAKTKPAPNWEPSPGGLLAGELHEVRSNA